jgi:CheY-like chemotaxis protein
MGHKVDKAMSGEEGLKMIVDKTFDLILMDIEMPGMSGMGTTKAIRALDDIDKASTPIFALTGNVQPEDISRYFAVNMNGHISKPVDPAKLKKMIIRCINNDLDNPVVVERDNSVVAASRGPNVISDDSAFDGAPTDIDLENLDTGLTSVSDNDAPAGAGFQGQTSPAQDPLMSKTPAAPTPEPQAPAPVEPSAPATQPPAAPQTPVAPIDAQAPAIDPLLTDTVQPAAPEMPSPTQEDTENKPVGEAGYEIQEFKHDPTGPRDGLDASKFEAAVRVSKGIELDGGEHVVQDSWGLSHRDEEDDYGFDDEMTDHDFPDVQMPEPKSSGVAGDKKRTYADAINDTISGAGEDVIREKPQNMVFRENMLSDLRRSMPAADFEELVNGYISKADEILSALLAMPVGEDLSTVGQRLHELKGMTGNFGFVEVEDLSNELNKAAHNGLAEVVEDKMPMLRRAHLRAKKVLRDWLDSDMV